jgi:hypothetical protein
MSSRHPREVHQRGAEWVRPSRDCLLPHVSDSDIKALIATRMVVGAAGMVGANKTFGEEKTNYYRESSSGANTLAYFVVRMMCSDGSGTHCL